jgi:hypothetical protein
MHAWRLGAASLSLDEPHADDLSPASITWSATLKNS